MVFRMQMLSIFRSSIEFCMEWTEHFLFFFCAEDFWQRFHNETTSNIVTFSTQQMCDFLISRVYMCHTHVQKCFFSPCYKTLPRRWVFSGKEASKTPRFCVVGFLFRLERARRVCWKFDIISILETFLTIFYFPIYVSFSQMWWAVFFIDVLKLWWC